MTSQMRVYYMALVGGIAGLTCWSIVTLAQYLLPKQAGDPFFSNPFTMGILGAALGALAVAFSDRWTEDQVLPSWVLAGMGIGLLMGVLGGLLATPIQTLIGRRALFIGQVLPWVLAGEFIGFGVGIRWVGVSRHRPLIAMFGGMVGATIGGLLFDLSGRILPAATDFTQASAFVLTGVGITCGITLAPALLSDGIIRFVSSGDPRAQNKLRGAEWLIRDGDRILVGSHQTRTIYRKEVELFLADSTVAPRHAYFFAEKGAFYIENHPENTGPQGLPLQPLLVGDREVIGIRKLIPGEIITLGSTQLRFQTKSRRGGTSDYQGR
jgi:hypothetical protein